jgi:3-keto-L-gulonate-6-phosphate decarboxylase
VFASDFFGAGVDWATVTGLSDEETISILRRLQRKLVGEYGSLYG